MVLAFNILPTKNDIKKYKFNCRKHFFCLLFYVIIRVTKQEGSVGMSNLLGTKQYRNLIDKIDDLTSMINILVSTINAQTNTIGTL